MFLELAALSNCPIRGFQATAKVNMTKRRRITGSEEEFYKAQGKQHTSQFKNEQRLRERQFRKKRCREVRGKCSIYVLQKQDKMPVFAIR